MALTQITPPSLAQLVDVLTELSDDSISLLSDKLKGHESVDLSDSEVERLSDTLRLPEDKLRYLLSLIAFLYSRLDPKDTSGDHDALLGFLENGLEDQPSAIGEKIGEAARRLTELVQHRGAYQKHAHRERLTSGFLPRLLQISNFVDIRPMFKRNENGDADGILEKGVIVAQLQIFTDSEKADERRVVIQLSPNDIKILENTIDDLKAKIAAISSEFDINVS